MQTLELFLCISVLGIDTGSPDIGKHLRALTGPAHVAILGKDRLIVENVNADLDRLPATGYDIHAIPMKLYDTCGAPIRLLAFRSSRDASAAAGRDSSVLGVLVLSMLLMGMQMLK